MCLWFVFAALPLLSYYSLQVDRLLASYLVYIRRRDGCFCVDITKTGQPHFPCKDMTLASSQYIYLVFKRAYTQNETGKCRFYRRHRYFVLISMFIFRSWKHRLASRSIRRLEGSYERENIIRRWFSILLFSIMSMKFAIVTLYCECNFFHLTESLQ